MTHAIGQDPENNPRMVLSMARDPELAFVVASRTAIPELLDEIERLRSGVAFVDVYAKFLGACVAIQRVRRALIDDSYDMNSWEKAVSVADILTALNGTEAKS